LLQQHGTIVLLQNKQLCQVRRPCRQYDYGHLFKQRLSDMIRIYAIAEQWFTLKSIACYSAGFKASRSRHTLDSISVWLFTRVYLMGVAP